MYGVRRSRAPSCFGLYGSVFLSRRKKLCVEHARRVVVGRLHGTPSGEADGVAATLAAAAVLAAALTACSGGGGSDEPQGGVAPHGASAVDAAVTNGDHLSAARHRGPHGRLPFGRGALRRGLAGGPEGRRQEGAPSPPRARATPDYYGIANWAQSPRIRKFVDELPRVGVGRRERVRRQTSRSPCPTRSRTPGRTTTSWPCASTPRSSTATCRRPGSAATCNSTWAPTRAAATRCSRRPIHYFGPLIKARRGRPVRIKFVNQLPPGDAGELFLPVDTTTTGAGTGPRAATRSTRPPAPPCTCTAG